MEEVTLKELWNSYSQKVEESLIMNRKNTEDITKLQIHSLLRSMVPEKLFALVAGLLWVGLLDSVLVNTFLFNYASANYFFLYSATIQVVLTKLAIGIYVYQLILIQQVDVSAPILTTQEKLAGLRTSTLWVTRLLFLQLPVWTTYYWNEQMFQSGTIALNILQGVITLSFTVAAIWLFINIRYENRHKRWFQWLFNGPEWTPLLHSMALLEHIDEYRETVRS